MEYWKNSILLLDQLVENDQFIEIQEDFKNAILDKVLGSCKSQNYLIAKLLIYGDINEDILLNFLFYTSINRKKFYDLFLENPNRYGNTFMFPIEIQYLPKISNILNSEEIEKLKKNLNTEYLVKEIKSADLNTLKKVFRTFYNYYKVNPFALKTE